MLTKFLSLFYIIFFSIELLSTPKILLEPTEFKFDKINKGETIYGSFTIKNRGDKSLKIFFQPNCDCLFVEKTELSLIPGDETTINFEFLTADFEGATTKEIIINSNDIESPLLFFKIEGEIISQKNKKNIKPTYDYKNEIDFLSLSDSNICYYFSYKSCKYCENISASLLKWTQNKGIKLYYYQLEDEENKKNIYEISKKIGYFPNLPMAIYNATYYDGKDKIENLIKNQETIDKIERVEKLNIFAIVISGLLDGINPCAFTVIILLLSYLTLQFKTRREILISGIFYTTTVFITYFLVGLGLFEFIRQIKAYSIISLILKYGITLFLIALAFISLYDFVKSIKGKKEDIILKLPGFIQSSIRNNIRKEMKNYRIFIGSVFLGATVSLFELACTGQVYFPIIGYMVRTTNERFFGFILLIVYNLGFITPLVIIFVLVFKGISSKKIGDFFGKNISIVKLLFFLLFIGFAVINLLI